MNGDACMEMQVVDAIRFSTMEIHFRPSHIS